uniref:Uncharacterized protein n=1 Tax=Anopheles darlingi TaxID=43151 RepID=A0A2M4D3H1_ANODA
MRKKFFPPWLAPLFLVFVSSCVAFFSIGFVLVHFVVAFRGFAASYRASCRAVCWFCCFVVAAFCRGSVFLLDTLEGGYRTGSGQVHQQIIINVQSGRPSRIL